MHISQMPVWSGGGCWINGAKLSNLKKTSPYQTNYDYKIAKLTQIQIFFTLILAHVFQGKYAPLLPGWLCL